MKVKIRCSNQNVNAIFSSDGAKGSVTGDRWCCAERGGDWAKKNGLISKICKSKDLSPFSLSINEQLMMGVW